MRSRISRSESATWIRGQGMITAVVLVAGLVWLAAPATAQDSTSVLDPTHFGYLNQLSLGSHLGPRRVSPPPP